MSAVILHAWDVRRPLTRTPQPSHACVTRMRLETKFLRLKMPVTLGSRFGDWQVCWVGGWTKHRLSYLVMVVRSAQRRVMAQPGR